MISTLQSFLINQVPKFCDAIATKQTSLNEFVVYTRPHFYFSLINFLRKNTIFQLNQLIEVVVIDRINQVKRFTLLYILSSTVLCYRLFVQLAISEVDTVHSLSQQFPNAIWMEREIWDLFGVFFQEHPDLRRILTDYGFDGFPLRKDFPLTGYFELRYDDELMHIVYEPVELSQNYRYFTFLSPWEQLYV